MGASQPLPASPAFRTWRMPVDPASFERHPLSTLERNALATVLDPQVPRTSPVHRTAEAQLARLVHPIHAVYALRRSEGSRRALATRVLLCEMQRRQQAFWQWSPETWWTVIGPTTAAFEAVQGIERGRSGIRPHLLDAAYLLCGFDAFGPVWLATAFYPMARVIFRAAVVNSQIARIDAVLAREGYATGLLSMKQRHQAIALLLLLQRRPWLDELTWPVLERAAAQAPAHAASVILGKVATALQHLGILAARTDAAPGHVFPLGPHDGVPAEWYAWYAAWRATGARGLAPPVARHYGGYILYTGRWLAARHPGIVSPEQWTEELALALRTAVLEETNALFVSADGARDLQRRGQFAQPLSHHAIAQFLAALRRFFRDLQTMAHAVGDQPARRIARRFDPRDALSTPLPVQKALAGAEPRDIAPAVWQRLAIQAARLTPADLGPHPYWPFTAVQALALLWVSTARRPNELLRLRLDCVRTAWEPAMQDEEGETLEPGAAVVGAERGAQVAYLHIPSSKYTGPAWIWIPQYTAAAIARWQQERGQGRAELYDPKDRAFADLLFAQRGKGMGLTFLNRCLIPRLCQKAGVDPRDAEGAYTAHRGRSARISLLHACGLTLEELAAYALHKDTHTIRKYARQRPIHLHRRVAQADTLSTVIEGLYDPNAAVQGLPAVRWFLGYDADGAPQFCGLPAHHTCPHRLDCAHCGLFIGGEHAKLIHDDPTGLRVTAEVPMTEAERLLSEGQRVAAARALAAAHALPAPVPPSVAYLTHPAGLSDERLVELADLATLDAVAQLTRVAADLEASLAELPHRDGRNVAVRALRQRRGLVQDLLARCQARNAASPRYPAAPESGDHPI